MPFRERDVSRDQAAAVEMVRRSGQRGVPVIVVNEAVIVGFNRRRLEQALASAVRPRPALGARVASAEAIARQRGVSLPRGAHVGKVTAGSRAAQAGLQEGDVILSLGGTVVSGPADLERALGTLAQGQGVEIAWWRGGQEKRGWLVL